MKVAEAIKKAKNNKDVKQLESDGYYLGSCFTMNNGENWTLHFFNPDQEKIANVNVDEKITIGKQDDMAKPMHKLEKEPKITLNKALEKAKENCNLEINKTVCILHKKEKLEWSITFFSEGLSVHSFSISAKNGKIEKENKDSLLQIN